MALKKGFLSKKHDLPKPTKFRFWIGIIMGILFALVLYCFLFLIREAIRSLLSEMYCLWTITEEEQNFYNLITAFFSSIAGMGLCIETWFNRPRQFGEKRVSNHRISIVTDQRNLLWVTLMWIFRAGTIYGLFFGMLCFFCESDVFPRYNYFLVLLLIVLFLNQWLTFRRILRKRFWRSFFLSLLIVSGYSFILSRIELVNTTEINNKLAEYKPILKYDIHVPYSSYSRKSEKKSLIMDIFMPYQSENGHALDSVQIITQKGSTNIYGLRDAIANFHSSRDEKELPFIHYRLTIDKRVKMKFVNQLKQELRKCCCLRIAYAVNYSEYCPKNCNQSSEVIYHRLPPYNYTAYTAINDILSDDADIELEVRDTEELPLPPSPPPVWLHKDKIINKTNIRLNKNKELYLNDSLVHNIDFLFSLKEKIKTSSSFVILVDDNSSFGNYLNIRSNLYQLHEDILDEKAIIKYNRSYRNLDHTKQKELRRNYALILIELTELEYKYMEHIIAHPEDRITDDYWY